MINKLFPWLCCVAVAVIYGCSPARAGLPGWCPLGITAGTNFYRAGEIEVLAGPAFSFTGPVTRMASGTQLGGTYWSSLHYGPGIRAGITSFSHLNCLLFDYSQADYNLRWPVWRLAPGARLALGKDFTDGSNYTEVDATLEFRFTKTVGIEAEAGDKFTYTKKAGVRGAVQLTVAF